MVEDNLKDDINNIIKKVDDYEIYSAFFLLIGFISPSQFLQIIKKNRSAKEKLLQEILEKENDKDLLIELCGCLKRYDLVKLLGSCSHKFDKLNPERYKLRKLWKILYNICENLLSEKDEICLKKLFPMKNPIDINYLEEYFVEAYQQNLFTDSNLNYLSVNFKGARPDISIILDAYSERDYPVEYYNIKNPTASSPCGLAVIINQEDFKSLDEKDKFELPKRIYSSLDANALKRLWEKYGFKTDVHKNLSDKEVLAVFDNLAKSDLSSYDIFVACYLSHGSEGVVYASNCKPVAIRDLISKMANDCTSLLDKPKLFFIQACQGKGIQRGVSNPTKILTTIDSNDQIDIQSDTPLFSDVLKVVSSIPGYVSFTEDNKLSWFIEALVKYIDEYGDKLSILDIMSKVTQHVSKKTGDIKIFSGEKISNCKQIPNADMTLRKIVKLKKLL